MERLVIVLLAGLASADRRERGRKWRTHITPGSGGLFEIGVGIRRYSRGGQMIGPCDAQFGSITPRIA